MAASFAAKRVTSSPGVTPDPTSASTPPASGEGLARVAIEGPAYAASRSAQPRVATASAPVGSTRTANAVSTSRQCRTTPTTASAGSSYEQEQGPFATQPAQQNGNPTWNVTGPAISISHVTQRNWGWIRSLMGPTVETATEHPAERA